MQLRTIQRSCFPPLHPAFSRHHATRFFPKRRVPVAPSEITLKWWQRDLFALLAASHCFSDSPAWFWGFGLSPKRHLGAVTCGRLDSGTEGRFIPNLAQYPLSRVFECMSCNEERGLTLPLCGEPALRIQFKVRVALAIRRRLERPELEQFLHSKSFRFQSQPSRRSETFHHPDIAVDDGAQ